MTENKKSMYEIITEENLISDSVMVLLTSNASPRLRRKMFTENNLAPMAQKICLLYTAFVQIYILGVTTNSKSKDEISKEIPDEAKKAVQNWWDIESSSRVASKRTFYSFLEEISKSGVGGLFGKTASDAISKISKACEMLGGNNRYVDDYIYEKFLNLIRNLPLLSKINFDFDAKKVVLYSANGEIMLDYSPFLEFWDGERSCTIKSAKNDDYGAFYPAVVLSSVEKGKNNHEMDFRYTFLDNYDSSVQSQLITKNVMDDELLRHICEFYGIQTEWHPVEKCWGDFSFLKNITEITHIILKEKWNIDEYIDFEDYSIVDKFSELFSGCDEMAGKIREENSATAKTLLSYLYGLFIRFGVFKTVKSMLLASNQKENEQKLTLFKKFLLAVAEKNGLSNNRETNEKAVDAYIETSMKKYEDTVSSHTEKLKKFLKPETEAYEKRLLGIKAEWRAFVILKAIGMQTENIFADIEDYYSIDDYFEMIKNPSTSLYKDLSDALRFLVVFYDSIRTYYSLHNNWKSDDPEIHDIIIKKRIELAERNYDSVDKELEALFDELIAITKDTQNTKFVSDTLKRTYICQWEKLERYKNRILKGMKDCPEEIRTVQPSDDGYVFISYKHNDDGTPPAFIEELANENVEYVSDKELCSGDGWTRWAEQRIKDEKCKAVYVFLDEDAMCSEPISLELRCAVESAERRYDKAEDRAKFIVPVSLVGDKIYSLLQKKVDANDDNAWTIKQHLSSFVDRLKNKKYLKWYSEKALILDELRSRAPVSDITGRVAKKNFSKNEMDIANFYGFLKFGDKYINITDSEEKLVHNFKKEVVSECIYPMVVSFKETQIKRDNITLVGYEIISGSNFNSDERALILTSEKLKSGEYYCIPNAQTTGNSLWMVEPFLIFENLFDE